MALQALVLYRAKTTGNSLDLIVKSDMKPPETRAVHLKVVCNWGWAAGGVGSITSRCSGNEAHGHERAAEIEPTRGDDTS